MNDAPFSAREHAFGVRVATAMWVLATILAALLTAWSLGLSRVA